MGRQTFFAGGRCLGARTIPDLRVVPGLEVRRHHSYALYCPRCGDIWARFLHDGADYTQLVHRNCAKHGDGRLANACVWPDDPTSWAADWPREAIRLELIALLNLELKEPSAS